MTDLPAWTPPSTLEERLKYALIPPRLYMWRLVRKHLRRGEPELRFLPRIVPADKIAVDIGANKGVYTHVLSRLCRRVEAFEPNPKIYRILARALPPNAIAHPVALSDQTGDATLIVPLYRKGYSNQHATLSHRRATANDGTLAVTQRTLDSYDFRDVGFIKIDVEGFEREVIAGGVETLTRERPTILMEIEERHTGEPVAAMAATMAGLGFDGFYLRGMELAPLNVLDEAQNRPGTPGYINNFIFTPR